MEKKPTTITIDEVKYVRADSVGKQAIDDGLEYVIVRSRNQGVMSGYLVSHSGQEVTLRNARQLWQWHVNGIALPDLANDGVGDEAKCRFSQPSECDVTMLEACGILRCTEQARDSLQGVKALRNDSTVNSDG